MTVQFNLFNSTILLLMLTGFSLCEISSKKCEEEFNELARSTNHGTDKWIPSQNCLNDRCLGHYRNCVRGSKQFNNVTDEFFDEYYDAVFRQRVMLDYVKRIEPIVVLSEGIATALFCAIPKTGSTAWKRVILKAKGASRDLYLGVGENYHEVHRAKVTTRLDDVEQQEQLRLIQSINVPRVVVVRNPYARVYSAYREKFLKERSKRQNYHRQFGLTIKKGKSASFSDFVHNLYSLYRSNTTFRHRPKQQNSLSIFQGVNEHWAWQSSFCGMQQGFGYDYVLKSELIDEWYPDIIKSLNFTQYVMSGWPEEDQCFLSVPKQPCNGPSLSTEGHKKNSGGILHNRGGNNHLTNVYDEQLAKMVTEIYYADLSAFSYPIWDGLPGTFRLI